MTDTPPEAPEPRPTKIIGSVTVGHTEFPLHQAVETPVEIAARFKLEIEWIQRFATRVATGRDRKVRGRVWIEPTAESERPHVAANLARGELKTIRQHTPWAISDDDYAALFDLCSQVLAGKGHADLVDHWLQAEEIPERLKDVNRKIGRMCDAGMTSAEAIYKAVQNELVAERQSKSAPPPTVDVAAIADALQKVRDELALARESAASAHPPAPAVGPDALVEPVSTQVKPICSHSEDFVSVTWFGRSLPPFSPRQAEVVEVLWNAWESGNAVVSEAFIAAQLDIEGGSADPEEKTARRFRLADTMRNQVVNKKGKSKNKPHPAMRYMIHKAAKGRWKLGDPPPTKKEAAT